MTKNDKMLHAYLVGLKCFDNSQNFGCECTIDVEDSVKEEFFAEHETKYDNCCQYAIVHVENLEHMTLTDCLRQQGATEFETAVNIWNDYEVFVEIPHLDIPITEEYVKSKEEYEQIRQNIQENLVDEYLNMDDRSVGIYSVGKITEEICREIDAYVEGVRVMSYTNDSMVINVDGYLLLIKLVGKRDSEWKIVD